MGEMGEGLAKCKNIKKKKYVFIKAINQEAYSILCLFRTVQDFYF